MQRHRLEFHPLKYITLSKEANQDTKGVFFIREEKDEKLCSIDGEDFLSFQQIKDKFGISPTIFLNQISRKKKHFLDKDEITHFIKDLSPEIEKIIDGKKMEMNEKHLSQNKECQLKQNSYNVLTKKKVAFPKNKGKTFNLTRICWRYHKNHSLPNLGRLCDLPKVMTCPSVAKKDKKIKGYLPLGLIKKVDFLPKNEKKMKKKENTT